MLGIMKYLFFLFFWFHFNCQLYSQDKIYYAPDGKELSSSEGAAFYKLNLPGDTAVFYYISGNLYFTGKMVDGKRWGECTYYLDDGRVNYSRMLENDQQKIRLVTPKPLYNAIVKTVSDKNELPRNEQGQIEWSGVINYSENAEGLYNRSYYALRILESEFEIDANESEKRVSRDFEFNLYFALKEGTPLLTRELKTLSSTAEMNNVDIGKIRFTISVYSRDGRYKYRAHNFNFIRKHDKAVIPLEIIDKRPIDHFVFYNVNGDPIKNAEARSVFYTQLFNVINGYNTKIRKSNMMETTYGILEKFVIHMDNEIGFLMNNKSSDTYDSDNDW